jgi:putative ABC transport system permease protein
MESPWKELRLSARSLIKHPGFTLPVIVVLAVGFGANTMVFTVLHSVLLEPLPFSEPDRLAYVWTRNAEQDSEEQVSAPDMEDLRKTGAFTEIAAFGPWGLTMTAAEDPERIPTLAATPNLFHVLGVRPLHGRTFSPEEGIDGQDRVVVLSYPFWKSRFGGDSGVVGRTIELDEEPYVVIGVLPPEMAFPSNQVGFWKPLVMETDPEERASRWLHVIGRLASGISPELADQMAAALSEGLAREYPETNRGWSLEAAPLHGAFVGKPRTALLFLQLIVGFVLLIACVNVANLLLARAESLRFEFAVRNALGASRGAQLSRLFAESFLLCLTGAALGLLIAWSGLRWLLTLVPRSLDAGDFSEVAGHAFPRFEQVAIDGNVLAASLLVLLATTVVFGLAPFIHSQRRDVRGPLAGGEDGQHQWLVRRGLVVAQVTLALALLIGAGLLLRSLAATLSVSPGFDPRGVLTMQASIGQIRDPIRRIQVLAEMHQEIEALPDVEAASFDGALPFTNVDVETEFRPLETEGADNPVASARLHTIGPNYFRTLRIPMRKGRAFDERDSLGKPLVVIVNEELARRYWPGRNSVGRRIVFIGAEEHPFEVVGVVADTHQEGLDIAVVPEIYTNFAQQAPRTVTFAVRATAGNPSGLTSAVKARLREVVPGLAIRHVFPLTTLVGDSTTDRRFVTLLTGLGAGLALLLAITGIYGMIAYSAAERSHELALRLALGAQRREIFRKVIGEGFRLGLAGVVLGLILALFLNRILRSLLFGVSATDPMIFLVVPLLLVAVACLAALPVARKATRLDPASALRYD